MSNRAHESPQATNNGKARATLRRLLPLCMISFEKKILQSFAISLILNSGHMGKPTINQNLATIKPRSKLPYQFLLIVLPLLSFYSNASNLDAQTLIHDGVTREYILIVPKSYDGTSRVPLMLSFHGFGGKASDFLKYTDWESIAESENFILVCPQGSELDGYSHWNPELEAPDNKSDVDDFGFIDALIDELTSNYNIDVERIYACGYSNGAFFTYALACYKSDRIAAIGSIAGTMFDEMKIRGNPTHPTAMINIHGTSDEYVPYGGDGEVLLSIESVLDYWISYNNTSTTPLKNRYNDRGTIIKHYAYIDGNGGSSVEHYKVIGGGHKWPDIKYKGDNTSRLIWDFVSRYDINGLRQSF